LVVEDETEKEKENMVCKKKTYCWKENRRKKK
jgi:hypothetical protein